MLQIALLGPLVVTRDGEPVPVPGGRTSELLVRLALEAGLPVRAERLVDDLWGTGALGVRRNTLQSKVTMLRRALGDAGVVTSRDGGYALAVDPSDVDALAALDRTAAIARLSDSGDDRAVAEQSASTLQLFGDEVLPAAGGGDWVGPHRTRLEETRTKLVELHFSARSRLGDPGMIGELETAVARNPLQESLWELLITALYRSGRQADALATYHRVRDLLARDLGLDPGPRLRRLEQRILTQDATLATGPPPVRGTGTDPPPGNLPTMSTTLVGRDAEVSELCALLARERLVVIVGPGGIGKTAVGLAVGRRWAGSRGPGTGGSWLARLETAAQDDDVVDVVVAAFQRPGGEAGLVERLRGTDALVILDNCEHVLDAAAGLAVRLLDAVPGLRVLCTSQVPLEVEGEAVVDLAPLTLANAVELFRARATDRSLGQEAIGADGSVLDLCRSLDGLPLAIELAAARTRTLSIDEIGRRLDDRFALLVDPASRKPERRRSLRSTIGWSYDLLFPDDQRGLWALAAFTGGASLTAAESVLEALDVPATASIDVVGRLVSRSLVIVDEAAVIPGHAGVGQGHPSVRYRLLDSIREFAIGAMTEQGVSERAWAAHAAWYAEAAGLSTEGVRGSHQAEHLSFARAERANIDAALAWASGHDPLLALDVVNGFGWAWVVLGDSRGATRILAALEAAGDGAPPGHRATALLLAAWMEASTGDTDLAHDHIAAAAELAEEAGDIDLQARCCYYLAYVVSHRGDFTRAIELTARSSSLYDGLDRPWDQAATWLFAARAAISAGDREGAVTAARHVRHWLRSVDDAWLHVRGEAMLGELARLQGRTGDAVLHIGRAAETSRLRGFLQTEAYQTTSLGRAQCQAGDYPSGAATLESGITKALATGDVRLAALGRVHLGRVLRALGEPGRARVALGQAAAWHRDAGGGEQAALGDCLLAALDSADRAPGAEHRLRAILEDARRTDHAAVEVFALDALARCAADAGDLVTAADLCAGADRRMELASHVITDRDRTDAAWVRQRV